MKNAIRLPLLLLAALGAQAAGAQCIYPQAPDKIPDGATATLQQMLAAQKTVKQFDTDIDAYNACLDMELQTLLANPDIDDARKAELREMQIKKHDAAVDADQAIADQFNEQVRAYQEAHKKKE